MRVQPYSPAYQRSLQELINGQLAAVVPGWVLPAEHIVARLERDYEQYVLDPWLEERATLCVGDEYRLLAAAHLQRYRKSPDVGEPYRGIGSIHWLVGRPDCPAALQAVLAAARERFDGWGVADRYATCWLPAPVFHGIPDTWPHVAAALLAAGYAPEPGEPGEALYGGWLTGVPAPGEPPVAGLTVRRLAGDQNGVWFIAERNGEEVGRCQITPDLTRGGALPALCGWASLWEMEVQESWRNRGIGSWIVQHAVQWLRLGGCDRVVIAVLTEDEAAGAARFYRRFGWGILARETRSWCLVPPK